MYKRGAFRAFAARRGSAKNADKRLQDNGLRGFSWESANEGAGAARLVCQIIANYSPRRAPNGRSYRARIDSPIAVGDRGHLVLVAIHDAAGIAGRLHPHRTTYTPVKLRENSDFSKRFTRVRFKPAKCVLRQAARNRQVCVEPPEDRPKSWTSRRRKLRIVLQ